MAESEPQRNWSRTKDRLEVLWEWATANPTKMDQVHRLKLATVEAEYKVTRDLLTTLMRDGREVDIKDDIHRLALVCDVSEDTIRAVLRRMRRDRIIEYDETGYGKDIHRAFRWYVMPASVIAELAEKERLKQDAENNRSAGLGDLGRVISLIGTGSHVGREELHHDREGVTVG